jgi:hypothetical protein
MSSADIQKVLVLDDRLAVSSEIKYAVHKGAQNMTSASFRAISNSTSQLTFNIQVPSEQVIIDRRCMLRSQLEFQVVGTPKLGEYLVNYGLTEAFGAFPLHQLFSTVQATINNNSTSINIRDVLPAIVRMNDQRELQAYNGLTATAFDTYKSYADAVGAINNPLGSWVNIGDNDLVPRGSLALDDITGNTLGDGSSQRTVVIKATFTEPLLMSPWLFADPAHKQGFYGIQNLNFVMNIGDTKRFWRTAKDITAASQYNSASYAVNLIAFNEPTLIFNFLTPHASQALTSPRNVVPYYELPRYITQFTSSIASGASASITTQTLQLNQVPDKLIIMVRKPMSSQLWDDTETFLQVNRCIVNWNNNSGILSSATQQDLYRYARENGSNQNWSEFRGQANRNPANPATLASHRIYTSGSLVVLDFGKDIQLVDEYYASGSIGSFSLQVQLEVVNNSDVSLDACEVCMITMNSGVFVCERGASSVFTALLTKQDVLSASQYQPYTRGDVKRLVGSGFLDTLKSIGSALGQQLLPIAGKVAEKAIMGRLGLGASGGAMSGGALSGGEMMGEGASGGAMSGGRMKKHLKM